MSDEVEVVRRLLAGGDPNPARVGHADQNEPVELS
jgi:hypothetical protein